MDMAMRSFVLAAALAMLGAAGLIAWSLFGGQISAPWTGADAGGSAGRIQVTGGSLYDEFGEGSPRRVVINSGSGLGSGAPRSGSGPRFDWSGTGGSDAAALPRETPAERVEADCRIRGGSSYGCRCLVRLARRDLSEAEFAFLSLAEEPQGRAERLQSAGIEARALGAVAGRLIRLDVEARRRCGAALAP